MCLRSHGAQVDALNMGHGNLLHRYLKRNDFYDALLPWLTLISSGGTTTLNDLFECLPSYAQSSCLRRNIAKDLGYYDTCIQHLWMNLLLSRLLLLSNPLYH